MTNQHTKTLRAERCLDKVINEWNTNSDLFAGAVHIEAYAAQQCADKDKRIKELETASVWQPIETAPKDGTDILLWVNDSEAVTGCTLPNDRYWSMPIPSMYYEYDHPTHWMPLPQPPSDQALAATEADND